MPSWQKVAEGALAASSDVRGSEPFDRYRLERKWGDWIPNIVGVNFKQMLSNRVLEQSNT